MTNKDQQQRKPRRLKCSICQDPILPSGPVPNQWWGGNNAQPINDGRCCDNCNSMVVIPARMKRMGLIK